MGQVERFRIALQHVSLRAESRSWGTSEMRILSVIGTRPEAIKMAPVAMAANRRGDVTHMLVKTGQHGHLIDQALAGFGIAADEDLALGRARGSLELQTARIRHAVDALLDRTAPDIVLVQGDTTSALAAGLAAHARGIPVGHVEAGLRSGDRLQPFPEEDNRIAIDALATLLFAPTKRAADNLARERVPGRVIVTGNTGIDALLHMRGKITITPALAGRLPSTRGKRLVLATCHRRENIAALPGICRAIRRIGARGDTVVVMPVHPNVHVRPVVRQELEDQPGVRLVPPLRYAAMVALLDRCALLLTDSGGLQEEAPALGKPTLVLRNVTERQEGLASGNLRLIGTEEERVVAEASRVLDDPGAASEMTTARFPFGGGGSAEAILAATVASFAKPRLVAIQNRYATPLRSKVA
jgi:UDP-N-acetylglucosamine 2-epimerase (non-hydrolysing)